MLKSEPNGEPSISSSVNIGVFDFLMEVYNQAQVQHEDAHAKVSNMNVIIKFQVLTTTLFSKCGESFKDVLHPKRCNIFQKNQIFSPTGICNLRLKMNA